MKTNIKNSKKNTFTTIFQSITVSIILYKNDNTFFKISSIRLGHAVRLHHPLPTSREVVGCGGDSPGPETVGRFCS